MRNIEIVELLLDKGAKVSAVDKVLFKTQLHTPVQNNLVITVLLVLCSLVVWMFFVCFPGTYFSVNNLVDSVFFFSQKGDTPLHIAIRGRSRKLAELLLRNPKDGRLLYRPNKAGETPYNIDCTHQKSILTQIFGASMTRFYISFRKNQNKISLVQKSEKIKLPYVLLSFSSLSLTEHLSPSESDGDMLGYDLYSSALADILSEPTMQPPICVGLYAQWGSGKSFLLKKLEGK